jgi:hypothetical protein
VELCALGSPVIAHADRYQLVDWILASAECYPPDSLNHKV